MMDQACGKLASTWASSLPELVTNMTMLSNLINVALLRS